MSTLLGTPLVTKAWAHEVVYAYSIEAIEASPLRKGASRLGLKPSKRMSTPEGQGLETPQGMATEGAYTWDTIPPFLEMPGAKVWGLIAFGGVGQATEHEATLSNKTSGTTPHTPNQHSATLPDVDDC